MDGGTRRRAEISRLNILLCLLVVFIHVTSYTVNALERGSWQLAAVFVPWKLSAFAVQGFVFLSGLRLSLNCREGEGYGAFLLSRLLRVAVPYALWNIVYYVYFVRHDYFPFELGALLRYILTGSLVSPFYFVVLIMQYYLLLPVSRAIVRRYDPTLMLALSAAGTAVLAQYLPQMLALLGVELKYNDRLFTTYWFFWVAGCYAGADYGRFKRALAGCRLPLTAAFLLSAAGEAGFGYIAASRESFFPWAEGVHYCYCILAVLWTFSAACAVTDRGRPLSPPAALIDRASYPIFLSHCLVINIVNDRLYAHGVTRLSAAYAVRLAVVFTVTLTACALWVKLRDALRRG